MSKGDLGTAIHSVIVEIDALDEPESVASCLAEFAAHFAISAVMISVPSLSGDAEKPDHVIGAKPESLATRFLAEENIDQDIAVRTAMSDMQALVWCDDTLWRKSGQNSHGLKAALDAHELNSGVLIPAFGGSGMAGFVVLAGHDLELEETDVSHLKVVATYAFSRACALQRAQLREDYGLSDREFECMKWVAAGKTDWEIGQILTISPKTVNYHVENAKRKMLVPTRVQAVMAALLSGGFRT